MYIDGTSKFSAYIQREPVGLELNICAKFNVNNSDADVDGMHKIDMSSIEHDRTDHKTISDMLVYITLTGKIASQKR